MAYVSPNYRTKKALRDAIKAGEQIHVYQPGLGDVPRNGTITLEGPHYPEPHRWYASGVMKDGQLISIK